jgi:regulator of ribonuclease activity A
VDFTTADLCDEYPQLIRVLDPLFRNYGGTDRFSGPVETVQVYEDNAVVRETLEAQGRGRVLVVDGGGSFRCALVGGHLGQLAQRNGWSGLLINGCVRDMLELARISIGIRALNTVPMRSAKEGKGTSAQRSPLPGSPSLREKFSMPTPTGSSSPTASWCSRG